MSEWSVRAITITEITVIESSFIERMGLDWIEMTEANKLIGEKRNGNHIEENS